MNYFLGGILSGVIVSIFMGIVTHISNLRCNLISMKMEVYSEYLSMFYKGFFNEYTDWDTYSIIEKK